MRRTFGSSQSSISGLLPIPLNGRAPDERDLQAKAKVPTFSTPKVQCLPDKLSEAREQPTVGNLGISLVQMSEEAVALTNRPSFSTPLVKACFPLENCTSFSSSLPQTNSSPSGDPLAGGKHQLTQCYNRDEQHHFR